MHPGHGADVLHARDDAYRLRGATFTCTGLSITPDGSTPVGIMQSALQQPDRTAKPAKSAFLDVSALLTTVDPA